jgi:hypothetical protein
MYKISGSVKGFSDLQAFGSPHFGRFGLAVASHLEYSRDLFCGLNALRDRLEKEEKNGRRVRAQVKSAVMLSSLGTVFFFPMFAGIGLQVLGFASQFSGSAAMDALPLLTFFVIAVNVTGSEYSSTDKVDALMNGLVAAGAGLMVFNSASIISGLMLR